MIPANIVYDDFRIMTNNLGFICNVLQTMGFDFQYFIFSGYEKLIRCANYYVIRQPCTDVLYFTFQLLQLIL
ncbi:hypothetical protein P2W68_08055 [Chryseobacterium arthrosphaerae]|uniref:hypothetical protein n=1 Tax=Chryseobacterium arthrosphaerae TaxID=651561 RepID=UPI0023E2CE2D|nr:hypothetical protein [Chryseobacterium arthrosphaerae]WES99563.1 hypothetical protein P2W68_08055 [Chryseobacterium arthrosphaerae]